MKPRSIISLIIAAVFVLGGIITCLVASAMADSNDVMLFPEADSEGNLVYKMELTATSKITVDAADADIIIKGGAEKSMIEVVNFNANYYKLTSSNGSVNFAQVDDFMSMFKFWDNGFSFKGMRYILRFGDDAAGGKRVVIRLSDEDDIRLVNLTTETGTISLEDCAFGADYTLTAESGKAEVRNITGASSISIYGNPEEVTAEECSADKFTVNGESRSTTLTSITAKEGTVKATDGAVVLKDSTIDKLSVSTASGSIDMSPLCTSDGTLTSESGKVTLVFATTDSVEANVATANGKISVNGEFKESFALASASPTHKISITTTSGDVFVTHP